VRKFRAVAVLVACVLVWATTSAVAQSPSGPIRLTPGSNPASEQPAPPRGESGRRDADDQPIAVGTLDPIDPSTAGILAEAEGGFPAAMWRGSSRERVEALLPRLPVTSPSPVMRSLARRLLLSGAALPDGPGKGPSLLGLRVERLFASGAVDEAMALSRLAPPGFRDPEVDRVVAEIGFLTGDNQSACGRVEQAIAAGGTGSFWLKRLGFCRALLNERDAARLATELLRELGDVGDEQFFAMLSILLGDGGRRPNTFGDISALHLAMLRAARAEVPENGVTTTAPAVLRALATAPNATVDVRLAATLAAEPLGVVTTDALVQLFKSVPFKSEEIANPKTIENATLMRRIALAYRVAEAQSIKAAQAEAIRDALALARSAKVYPSMARALKAPLAQVTPEVDLIWFAGEAGIALLTAGDLAAARPWFDLARAQVSKAQPEAVRAIIDLWPLFQLGALERPAWDPAILKRWHEGLVLLPDDKRRARLETTVAALDAVGFDVDPAVWSTIVDGTNTPPSAPASAILLRALRAAADAGRIGETVVLALIALGEAGPVQTTPIALDAVLRALRGVGLNGDAQALAFEAVLGQTQN
jgi:hypothetical protein